MRCHFSIRPPSPGKELSLVVLGAGDKIKRERKAEREEIRKDDRNK
jgi:hypothetical protein